MEFIIEQDIQNIKTKKYTEDREVRYRKHFKAIKEFFETCTTIQVPEDTPALLDIIHEGNTLISDISYYLSKHQVFDLESYLKFLEVFKEILQFKNSSDEISNLLEYLHL